MKNNNILLVKARDNINPVSYSEHKASVVVFEEGVKSIPYAAFANNENIQRVVFNEDLEKIGDRDFAKNISLRFAVLPESLKEIGKDVFFQCSTLETVACSQATFNEWSKWLGKNPATISIVIYNTAENWAREVIINPFRHTNDNESKTEHKAILFNVQRVLKEKGITSSIERQKREAMTK